MADNLGLDAFVAGQTLTDVGGKPASTALDLFVAGQLYAGIDASGPTTTFAGEAGSEMLSASVAAQRNTVAQAGGEMYSTTMAVSSIVATHAAGTEMSHTVTVMGLTSAVTQALGSEMYVVTRKYVPADAVPGSLARLGVGF